MSEEQDGHQAADLCKVISWIRKLCGPDPPPQTQNIRSFKVARHFSYELLSASSYLLLVGKMAEDILKDPYEKMVSPQTSMKAKRLTC